MNTRRGLGYGLVLCAAVGLSVPLGCASNDADSDELFVMDGNALIRAASLGKEGTVEDLLDHGARVNEANAEGRTAMHAAAAGGHDEIVELLALRGGNVNAADESGNTPLHLAAAAGHEDTMLELLKRGAARTPRNDDGKTPGDIAHADFAYLVR